MAQTDVYVTIETESNGNVVAEAALNDIRRLNQLTRGGRATLDLLLGGDSGTLTVESGETYTVSSGTTEIFASRNVQENGQVNVEEGGTLNMTGGDGIEILQKYQDYAGKYTVSETLDSTQRYKDNLPSGIDVSSLVVGINPASKLQTEDIPGVWGLVDRVEDSRNTSLNQERYELSVRVLDRYSAYSDHASIKGDLEL